ncbi:acyl-CoA dehydrogenase, partial [Streptomyces sp. NPDC058953]
MSPDPARPPAGETGPNLLYSDTDEALRASVRALLDDRADVPALLERAEAGDPYDRGQWEPIGTPNRAAPQQLPDAHRR